jgi:photosystem II stability/assembly factor-like uncharacterized protein
MAHKLIAASDQGLFTLARENSGWEPISHHLQGERFTAVAASGTGAVLAGTREGIYLSLDSGATWQKSNSGLKQLHIRSLAFHPDNAGFAYAGTEPAAIFYSKDGGHNWQECVNVPRYREENDWYLPYSPEAGCIRGFSFAGELGYAAVEVGGMLVSHDFGESWQLTQETNTREPADKKIHADVHRVYIHSKSKNTVIAPTGGGLYLSEDGAQAWDLINPSYCRAAWSPSGNWDEIIFGAANGPDRNGRILRTTDGGKHWEPADAGLDTPWDRTMIEHLVPAGDELFAVLSNGRLIVSQKGELRWETVIPPAQGVRSLAVLN